MSLPGEGLDLRAIARRLAALPDGRMRAAVLRDILLGVAPTEAAWILDGLAVAGRAGSPPFDLALLAAVDLASRKLLPEPYLQLVINAAGAAGMAGCIELLSSEALQLEDENDEDDGRAPRPLVPGTRPLTLGERKSLAKSWKRDVVERLIVDPHVDVVTLLLKNPRLTEADVIRLATTRRASAAVLGLIYETPRWICRPRVRMALLRNPRLPEDSAVRLVGLLSRTEQRELARDHTLPRRVRVALERRLKPLF